MRILVLASALDLRLRLSSTPHWWQLLKALAVEGADLTVVPYAGRPVESLYWRGHDNPCLREGQLFGLARRILPAPTAGRSPAAGESWTDRLVREAARAWIRPRWLACVRALFAEVGFDAVLLLNVPLNHLGGLATEVRARHRVPVWYYDGDLPSSLPEFGGLASSFRFYEGADLSEYDGFFSNSVGAVPKLQRLGVRRVEVVHWAADPEVYRPIEREQDLDTFFHGYGEFYRLEALEAMIYEPCRKVPERKFALGGKGFDHAPPSVVHLGDVPFAHYGQACARAKVNLIVTRSTHADLEGTSSARPFELGAMGVAAVSNPWNGLERWFEPGREVLVVRDAAEAQTVYRELWDHPSLRREMGQAMRRRVLAEHTYSHRARQLLACLREGPQS
jgi:glycosyltransferase involved in cell wall biosynthesis